MLGSSSGVNPLSLIWRNSCPFKIEVFVWLAVQNKIATRGGLLRINMLVNGSDGNCPFCRTEVETTNHVLLHC